MREKRANGGLKSKTAASRQGRPATSSRSR